MTAARKIIKFPRPRRLEFETAFLPAALEVVETPPSPIGRAIGVIIILLFCAALVWASLGKVDIVATAHGRVILNGRTKIIQPAEGGVVRAIHVQDGSVVKAGDVLIELDPTISTAELEHVRSDLIGAQLNIARLRAALDEDLNPGAALVPPEGASGELVAMHRQFLASQVAEHVAKLSELDRQLAQKKAERETISATIAKLNATIPLLQERVDVRKYLFDKQIGSKLTFLSEAQELVGQQHDVAVQESRLREGDAAIAELGQVRLKVEAEYRRALYEDLAKAEERAAGLSQDLIKGEQKAKHQLIAAPVDGVVQQLTVHTIGGVVTPAQALAVVVALDRDLEIEAMVANRDIGFVVPGQTAAIKIDTFNFARYGLLHGRVISVSRDAILRDGREDKTHEKQISAGGTSSESEGGDPLYAARISLDQNVMEIDGRPVPLLPGMAVTVEIGTGSRRIISYLLSPLTQYRQEVLRER